MSRILVIDDEAAMRRGIREMLRSAHHEVLEGEDAEQGLELVRTRRPDLVICDLHLRGRSGWDVLDAMRSDRVNATIPLILITGSDAPLAMRQSMDLGADDFLRKPLTDKVLLAAVDARLKRQEILKAQAEQASQQLLGLLEATDDLVAIVDPLTRAVRYMNRAARRLTGLDPDRTGEPVMLAELYPPQAFSEVEDQGMPSALRDGAWHGESKVATLDGGHIHVLQEILVHRVADGAVDYLSIIAHDITERKRAEQALRDSEARSRALTHAAFDAIILMDPDGRISFWNPAAERIFGYSEAEVLGKNLHALLVPERYRGAHDVAFPGFRSTGQGAAVGRTLELAALRKDGSEFPVELSLSTVSIEGGWHTVSILRDITLQKEATQMLQRKRILLRTLVDALPYCIYAKDREARKTLANRADVQSSGAANETDVLGKTDYELLDGKTAAACHADDLRVITGGETVINRQELLTKPNGEQRWLETTKLPLRDEIGRIVGLVGIGHDITERRRADEQLRVLSMAVEQSPASVVITDTAGRIQYVNPKFCALTGYQPAEVIGQNPRVLKSGEISAEEYQELWRSITSGREWRGEFHNRKKDGELYWEFAVISAIKDADGNLTHFVAVKQDITERKMMERDLRQSEERFRRLFENSQDAMVTLAPPSWRFTSCNRAAMVLFAVPDKTRFTTLGPWDLSPATQPDGRPSPEQALEMLAIALRDGSHFFEWTHQRLDGSEFPATALLTRLELSGQPLIQATVRDITDAKRLETDRDRMELQLRHAQKLQAIGQLAAGIAHEINTPVQFIGDNTRFLGDAFGGQTEFLGKCAELIEAAGQQRATAELAAECGALWKAADLDYLRSEVPAALRQTLEGVERISKIVRAMKDFSHPGTEEKSLVDLNRLVESTLTVCRNEWKYVADLVTDFDPSLTTVPCLPGEFNQVILNLAVNAAHAIGDVLKLGAASKGTLTVTTRRIERWAEVRIADTGTGIPESARPHIFEPFFTTKDVGRGTGQGLAIAHSVITDKHGGTIHFETETGKGTTFILRLPLVAPTVAKTTPKKADASVPEPASNAAHRTVAAISK